MSSITNTDLLTQFSTMEYPTGFFVACEVGMIDWGKKLPANIILPSAESLAEALNSAEGLFTSTVVPVIPKSLYKQFRSATSQILEDCGNRLNAQEDVINSQKIDLNNKKGYIDFLQNKIIKDQQDAIFALEETIDDYTNCQTITIIASIVGLVLMAIGSWKLYNEKDANKKRLWVACNLLGAVVIAASVVNIVYGRSLSMS